MVPDHHIMLFPDKSENDWEAAFVCVIRRLLVGEGDPSVERYVVSDTELGQVECHECTCNVHSEEFIHVVRSVVGSPAFLEVEFNYPLAAGGEAWLNAQFRAAEFEREDDGFLPWGNQQIVLRLYRRNPGGPWKSGASRAIGRQLGDCAHGLDPDLAEDHAFQDVTEVLLRALGLLDQHFTGSGFSHAFVSIEQGWVPALTCSTVFHRQIHEFAADLARAFVEFNYGIATKEMLDPNVDFWGLDRQRLGGRSAYRYDEGFVETWQDADPNYREGGKNSLLELLREQPQSVARRCAATNPFEIVAELRRIAECLHGIAYLDFGKYGGLLAGHPRQSLSSAYEELTICNSDAN